MKRKRGDERDKEEKLGGGDIVRGEKKIPDSIVRGRNEHLDSY